MITEKINQQTIDDLSNTGSLSQLYRVRRYQISEGQGAGAKIIDVRNASGLQAVFNENHALDLFELNVKGVNIGFMTKNDLVNTRVIPIPTDFHRTWPGGLLATCGLRNTGPDQQEGDEYHPLHGLIGGGSAEQVSVRLDEQARAFVIEGFIRETAMFGHHLLLKRKIIIALDSNRIEWEDRVENCDAAPQPVFLLYHFNFGYPFLSPELELTFPPGEVIPRTKEAENGLEQVRQITPPVDGEPEQVFFHYPMRSEQDTGSVCVELKQKKLNLNAKLFYNPDQLPVLSQWKSMKSGDYALGIEPGTSQIRGRLAELADSYPFILPGYSAWPVSLALEID